MPASLCAIGTGAFQGSGLTSVAIPFSTSVIEPYTFADCENLSSVYLPNTITSIGEKAFHNCASLHNVESLAQQPPELGYYVFGDTPTDKILRVRCNAVENYDISVWSNYFSIITCEGLSALADSESSTIDITLSPNPADSRASVRFDGLTGEATLQLIDAQGRVVLSDKLSEGENSLDINVEGLSAGVYYIRIITQGATATRKLIVQ